MRGHDDAALAVREALGEGGVEVGEVGDERVRGGGVGRGVVGVDVTEGVGDGRGQRGEPLRVEPEVGIERVVVVLVVLLGVVIRTGDEVGDVGGVDHVLGVARVDGLVDGALEAGQVQDEVGLADGPNLSRGQLDVMRLGPGGRQRGDGDELAAHLLGDVLQRVEGREHLHRAAPAALRLHPGVAGRRGVVGRGAAGEQQPHGHDSG